MSTTARDIGNITPLSGDKLHQVPVNEHSTTYVTEQLSKISISRDLNPTFFIAELDSTPIEPKKITLAPIRDAIVTVEDDTNNGDCQTLAGEKPAVKSHLEQVAKVKAARMKDPAVLVNLPTSPSAQAYEVARDTQGPGDTDYFDPVYADTDDHDSQAQDKAT